LRDSAASDVARRRSPIVRAARPGDHPAIDDRPQAAGPGQRGLVRRRLAQPRPRDGRWGGLPLAPPL